MDGKLNLDDARRFLDALDSKGEFTFQTFAERKSGKDRALARVRHSSFDQVVDELVSLNTAEPPAGIFVTVNETNKQGRKAADIVRVRAVFVDLDGAPIEPVLEGPLAPSIVVETSAGRYHAYWLTKDVPLQEFSGFQRLLIERFSGDPVVNDLPRVMRLPGFLHQKHEPFLSRLNLCKPELIFTREALIEAFGSPEAPAKNTMPCNASIDATFSRGLALELAGQAIRRAERSRGRHKQALALGLECRKNALPIDAALQAAEVFFANAPSIDSDGQPCPPDWEDIRNAVVHAYDENVIVEKKKTLAQFVLSGPEIAALEAPPREMIVDPFITASSLSMIYAKRGVGKTWFALELARACSTGTNFFRWSVTRQQKVLYVDGEMPNSVLKYRAMQLFGDDPPENFMLLPSETLHLLDHPLRINDPDEQHRFLQALEDLEARDQKPDVIIFDNLSSLTSGLDENSNSELDVLLSWLVQLRHRGYAIILVHHAGKNGTQRGASRREDLLDTTIKLEELSNSERGSARGAAFTIEFEKVRGEWPNPKELTVYLSKGPQGELVWMLGANGTLSAAERALMEIAKTAPQSQKALAATLKVSEPSVSQTVKRLRDFGFIDKKSMHLTSQGLNRLESLGFKPEPV